MADQQPFYGTSHVAGSASAKLLAAGVELSFWGGVDPRTGEVIDRFHPLSGCFLKDTILAIPGSRGSCGGSVVMMELMLNGQGPKALIFERPEEIITLGVMVAEEMFDETAAVVTLDPKDFRQLLKRNGELVHVRGREVSTTILETQIIKSPTASATTINESSIHLTDDDCAILSGEDGEAAKVALRIIIRMSKMMDAQELMSVSQAHADSAWYGPGSVAFGKRLRDYGGKFKVPTTINAINVDQKRWRALGVNSTFGVACDELAQAYLEMGGTMSFTCAPYLLDTVPKLGDMIAWGESNAVIYANSVLGARSLKNPNMLEALIALTGRAPKAGVYLDENRLASIWLKICPPAEVDDSFWPILGFAVGAVAMARIPVISGLEHFKPTKDDFKAFSAAFATSSSAPMFHMVNLTPEAPTLGVVFSERTCPEAILLNGNDLFAIWDEFNHGCEPRKIDLISLGNPHFSAKEMKKLLSLCQGRVKKDDVALIITCGRAQYSLASQAGYVKALEDFGVQFLQDTCWCSIEEPIIPFDAKTIMTNSGKYIHYGPGLTGRQFAFGNLAMCVDAACSGKTSGEPPLWLLQTKSDVA
jgi:predicted aconitase/predicted aconitase with swiveling domain